MGGLYPGGLKTRIIYLLANGSAYIRGGLKTGGASKWNFTVFLTVDDHSTRSFEILRALIRGLGR